MYIQTFTMKRFWHNLRYLFRQFIKVQTVSCTMSTFTFRDDENIKTFGVPYDLGSVMHYGPTAFTNDWTKHTISTKDPLFQKTIGQREQLGFQDARVINEAYCSDRCRGSRLPCLHGGYPHPVWCNRCVCPDGLGGTYCETNEEPKNHPNCGGVIRLNGHIFNISSPNYPKSFDVDQKCSWLVVAPAGRQVYIDFIEEFNFFCPTTCLDFVETKVDSDLLGNTGMRHCCDKKPGRIYASGNKMVVIFQSNVAQDAGFKAQLNFFPEIAPPPTPKPAPTPSTTRRQRPQTIPQTTTPRPTRSPEIWGSWTQWSQCSRSCGACGIARRSRYCIQGHCRGRNSQMLPCGYDICPFNRSNCNAFARQLDQPPSSDFDVSSHCKSAFGCCHGFEAVRNECVKSRDAPSPAWSEWGPWSKCLGPECGACASQTRKRTCLITFCREPSTESRRCNTKQCRKCTPGTSGSCPCCAPMKPKYGECLPP